jgi:ubiquitin carboxyl-terminal hydrolase L3
MGPNPPKTFYPLESNPDVFNELIRLIGVSPGLHFEDIYSLDDPSSLPHPALALILVFPADDVLRADALSDRTAYTGSGPAEPVVWFKQTIGNACGLYAILHALCNGAARSHIGMSPICPYLLFNPFPTFLKPRRFISPKTQNHKVSWLSSSPNPSPCPLQTGQKS